MRGDLTQTYDSKAAAPHTSVNTETLEINTDYVCLTFGPPSAFCFLFFFVYGNPESCAERPRELAGARARSRGVEPGSADHGAEPGAGGAGLAGGPTARAGQRDVKRKFLGSGSAGKEVTRASGCWAGMKTKGIPEERKPPVGWFLGVSRC